jgi:hypothetical protein
MSDRAPFGRTLYSTLVVFACFFGHMLVLALAAVAANETSNHRTCATGYSCPSVYGFRWWGLFLLLPEILLVLAALGFFTRQRWTIWRVGTIAAMLSVFLVAAILFADPTLVRGLPLRG